MIIESKPFITPSEVIEYLYCPRYIYFMNTLDISQHEKRRSLVQKGRDIHELKLVRNKDYLRKKLNCVEKQADAYLTSEKLMLVGRVDEVLLHADGTMAPLDYKVAFWEGTLYKTLYIQQVLYALLIEENYQKEVNRAYLVYVRSNNHVEEITISQKAKDKAKLIVQEIFDIISINYYPAPTKSKRKCEDCTYRNICNS